MDQAQNIGVDDEFTMFSKLAPELRIDIWELALTEPRTITIDTTHYPFKIMESEKSPSLLQVSKEARSVALRSYQPSFSTVDGSPRYFDFRKDTLQLHFPCIERVTLPPFSLGEEVSKVQNLKYHGGNLFRHSSQRSFHNKLKPFKSLKNLIVHHTPNLHQAVSKRQRDDESWWKGVDDHLVEKFEKKWKAYTRKLEESDGGKDFTILTVALMPRKYYIVCRQASNVSYIFQ